MGIAKQLWYGVPAEVAKGAIKGQYIRLANVRRYKKLMEIRPPRRLLAEKKKELLLMIKDELCKRGISAVDVFGRIKTIGSLDRKERYSQAVYPSAASDYLREDILGATVLVRTSAEAYNVLDALKSLGTFPTLSHRQNPRDYFNESEKVSRPELPSGYRIGIVGNLSLEGFPCQIHARIFLAKDYPRHVEHRGQYLKAVWKRIKKYEAKSPNPLAIN